MNFCIITQARFNSKRLPGKIFLNYDKENFFSFFLRNLKRVKFTKLIVASPKDEHSGLILHYCDKLKIPVFFYKGNENNVLARYYYCAKKFKTDNIIRITSDCPFINPDIVNKMIEYYKDNNLNFLTNNKPRRIPHGYDCEIFSYDMLKNSFYSTKNKYDLEHVTPWMYKNYFKKKNYYPAVKKNFSKLRLTLDTKDDYIFFIKNQNDLKKIAVQKNYEKLLSKFQRKIGND